MSSPAPALASLWIVMAAAAAIAAADAKDPLEELAAARGQPERVPTVAVASRWKFSSDGGKTYTLDSVPPVPMHGQPPVFATGAFQIDDPAKVGTLWITTDSPIGGMSPAIDEAIGRRYVSRVPVLLKACVSVNGKPLVLPESDDTMLLARYGIDPALLKTGQNVINVSGLFWNTWVNMNQGRSVKVGFKLSSSPPDALELRTGPVLGPLGDDYFTLVCRTHIPAEIKVTVKPMEPAGTEKIFDLPRGTLHRARIDLPKGTRRFRYTVTASNGPYSKVTGPLDVRIPVAGNMRFVVLGQTATNGDQLQGLAVAAKALRKLDPDFIIHTGSIVKMAYYDFEWDESFMRPWRDVLARTPICVVPAYRDCYSMAFGRLFYHATADGSWDPWTWSIGNVRFIGMDSLSAAANAQAVAPWVEQVLQGAKEDYVFSVNAYPGFGSHPFGRGIDGHNFDRTVIHPLLVKYKVTAALGCTGAYEYVPAPGAKGVPTIITGGVGAEMTPGWTQYHYCVFTVKDGKCDMEAIAYETGKVIDKRTFQPRQK
jgi:hypothetical protein